MEYTIVATKVIAIYFVVSGLFVVLKGKTLPLILRDMFEHPAVVFITGVIMVFAGSAMLLNYSAWDGTVRTVVTVFGWAVLLKGLAYVFFPKLLADFPINKFRNWFGFLGLVLIIAGIYLFRIV